MKSRDYSFIAQTISNAMRDTLSDVDGSRRGMLAQLAIRLANRFEKEDTSFNRVTFLAECGVSSN